jgi:hypothetical protein
MFSASEIEKWPRKTDTRYEEPSLVRAIDNRQEMTDNT